MGPSPSYEKPEKILHDMAPVAAIFCMTNLLAYVVVTFITNISEHVYTNKPCWTDKFVCQVCKSHVRTHHLDQDIEKMVTESVKQVRTVNVTVDEKTTPVVLDTKTVTNTYRWYQLKEQWVERPPTNWTVNLTNWYPSWSKFGTPTNNHNQ